MPLLTKRNGGKIIIVNLQSTKQDKKAHLKIHCYIDQVMKQVCQSLDVKIPHWEQPMVRLQSLHTPKRQRSPKIIVAESLQRDNKLLKKHIKVNNSEEGSTISGTETTAVIKVEKETHKEQTENSKVKSESDERKTAAESGSMELGLDIKEEEDAGSSDAETFAVNVDRCGAACSINNEELQGKHLSPKDNDHLNGTLQDFSVGTASVTDDEHQEVNTSQTKRLKLEV